jgi:NADPH2:quinone reductase
MRAIVYRNLGNSDVLQLVERPDPIPKPGEVVVDVVVSGVNPTDWKVRKGTSGQTIPFPEVVPNQDGAGVITGVGPGVDQRRIGERVWIWEAAYGRSDGTAQDRVAVPDFKAVPLADRASWELGASLGIPALTAHRCLMVGDEGPKEIRRGSMGGSTVLVAGGAGAVGHAAIQLAVWAGARVISTVSSHYKAELARAAGAHKVINYRDEDVRGAVTSFASDGVNLIVEVAPTANAELDRTILAPNGTVAIYATDSETITLPIRPSMVSNFRYQFIMVYTVSLTAKQQAIRDVNAGVNEGVLEVGEAAGMPLHFFPLEETAAAHDAVEGAIVGKVLVSVDNRGPIR